MLIGCQCFNQQWEEKTFESDYNDIASMCRYRYGCGVDPILCYSFKFRTIFKTISISDLVRLRIGYTELSPKRHNSERFILASENFVLQAYVIMTVRIN